MSSMEDPEVLAAIIKKLAALEVKNQNLEHEVGFLRAEQESEIIALKKVQAQQTVEIKDLRAQIGSLQDLLKDSDKAAAAGKAVVANDWSLYSCSKYPWESDEWVNPWQTLGNGFKGEEDAFLDSKGIWNVEGNNIKSENFEPSAQCIKGSVRRPQSLGMGYKGSEDAFPPSKDNGGFKGKGYKGDTNAFPPSKDTWGFPSERYDAFLPSKGKGYKGKYIPEDVKKAGENLIGSIPEVQKFWEMYVEAFSAGKFAKWNINSPEIFKRCSLLRHFHSLAGYFKADGIIRKGGDSEYDSKKQKNSTWYKKTCLKQFQDFMNTLSDPYKWEEWSSIDLDYEPDEAQRPQLDKLDNEHYLIWWVIKAMIPIMEAYA